MDPNGKLRWELYAVSESGTSVLLYSQENMDILDYWPGTLGWTSHDGVEDGLISFAGRQYVSTETGYVVGEYGIYVATLNPTDLPDADGPLDLEWALLPLEFTLVNNNVFHVIYDWSPDGTALLYEDLKSSEGGIWLASDEGSYWSEVKIHSGDDDPWGCGARWSNDGTQIALWLYGDLCTMDADGTNVATVVEDPEDTRKSSIYIRGRQCWSPSDTHLLYVWQKVSFRTGLTESVDIYRVELTGGAGTEIVNLTADTDARVEPMGWVE